MGRDIIKGNLAGAVCMIVWSLHFPLSVAILKTWDPLALAPVRMGLAGVTVALVALVLGQARQHAGIGAQHAVCAGFMCVQPVGPVLHRWPVAH